jgi:hypothetical protein
VSHVSETEHSSSGSYDDRIVDLNSTDYVVKVNRIGVQLVIVSDIEDDAADETINIDEFHTS